MKKTLLTLQDKIGLELELKELIEVRKPDIIKQIQEARQQGDLSENADYDAAKNEQAAIEKRINEIKSILDNYEIIKDNEGSKDFVGISKTVVIWDFEDEKEYTFKIHGAQGADPKNGIISNESPLAKSIMNHRVNDVVEVKGIENTYKVKILEIK